MNPDEIINTVAIHAAAKLVEKSKRVKWTANKKKAAFDALLGLIEEEAPGYNKPGLKLVACASLLEFTAACNKALSEDAGGEGLPPLNVVPHSTPQNAKGARLLKILEDVGIFGYSVWDTHLFIIPVPEVLHSEKVVPFFRWKDETLSVLEFLMIQQARHIVSGEG